MAYVGMSGHEIFSRPCIHSTSSGDGSERENEQV